MKYKDFSLLMDVSIDRDTGPLKRRWLWFTQEYQGPIWLLIPLLLELAGFWQHEKYEGSHDMFHELESSLLREVGFHQSFDNAEVFLGALIKAFRERG